jgi:hypothetical protein
MMRQKVAQPGKADSGAKGHARGHLHPAAPVPAPRGMPGSLLALQGTIGNAATARLIQRCRDGHT